MLTNLHLLQKPEHWLVAAVDDQQKSSDAPLDRHFLWSQSCSYQACLGAQAYDKFCAMLRVNTSLFLNLPPFNDRAGDQRLVDSRNQMRIEQRLNHLGRGGLLSSIQTPRKEWVDALSELMRSMRVPSSTSAACTACSD
jgi:hypothetical protein